MYFVLGGLLVSLSTYLGSHGRGFFAALASTFPMISGVTFILIYVNVGTEPTISFAKHLIWLSPPWFVYVLTMLFGVERLGFWSAYGVAMTCYMLSVWMMRALLR